MDGNSVSGTEAQIATDGAKYNFSSSALGLSAHLGLKLAGLSFDAWYITNLLQMASLETSGSPKAEVSATSSMDIRAKISTGTLIPIVTISATGDIGLVDLDKSTVKIGGSETTVRSYKEGELYLGLEAKVEAKILDDIIKPRVKFTFQQAPQLATATAKPDPFMGLEVGIGLAKLIENVSFDLKWVSGNLTAMDAASSEPAVDKVGAITFATTIKY